MRRYYRLLDRLSGEERSIFVARTLEGLTLEEVAAQHGVSVSTAQRRIERATARMALLVRRDPLLAAFVEGGAPMSERDRELLAPPVRGRAAAEADAGAGPAPEAWHRLRQARERDRARAAGPRRWTLPAVAVAGLALALGGWVARRARPLTYVVSGGQVEANGYVTSVGAAPTELRFSDGTRVQLARGARMSVAASGPRGARLRVEDGQAHFEVTHRPGADWSVEAGPYRVQVTGTVFDVRWSAGDEAAVALRVGSVRVTGPHLATPLTLAPGQRLVARLATGRGAPRVGRAR